MANQRELAEEEGTIWSALPLSERTQYKYGIGDWARATRGAPYSAVRRRHQLWLAGHVADPLWDAIDNDNFSLYSAVRIMADAMKTGAQDAPVLTERIRAALKREKDERIQVVSAKHRMYFRRNPRMKSVVALERQPGIGNGLPTWTTIRAQLHAVLLEKGKDLDVAQCEQLAKQLESELQALMHFYANRIDTLKHKTTTLALSPATLRRHMVEACLVLGLKPPKVGKLAEAKPMMQRFRMLVKKAHPDLEGGSTSELERLMRARQAIEEYNAWLGGSDA